MRHIASVLVLLSVVTLMGDAQSPASDIPTLLQPGSLLQPESGSIRGRVLGAGTDEPLMRRHFDVTHYRSLIFADWNRPTADDRALVYQKGAYVLHLLRETLGEAKFWAAIRDYTHRYDGTSVTTVEFQHAMERSTRTDLSIFFTTWVYLEGLPK
jgi:hypothetical protein